jgi:hypothetical protein
MRLPIGLAAIALLGLLGGAVGASTAIAPQASNAADPTAAEAMNEASAVTNTSADADNRASEIGQCVSGAPGHLPDGTDANVFCTCAVDKMLTNNATQRDAINQCASEMHITLRNME